jgi:ABC-type transport system involved in multi-copper enzyme maturation permease subunit
MSTIPPATTDPTPPAGAPGPGPAPGPYAQIGPVTPGETAPSTILSDVPALTRVVGVIGLFFTVLGLVVIGTTRAIGPRIVSESLGFVSAGLGLACLLYHSVTDNEQEIRRIYGLAAGLLLVVGLVTGLIPGPYDGTGSPKLMGYYVMPWGLGCGLLGLLFLTSFTRHETDDFLRDIGLHALLALGALLSVGIVVAGMVNPDFLAGPGLPLALLGIGFLCAYLGNVDTSEGLGYGLAFAVGALGAAVLCYTFAKTVFPTVLYEGPSVLRDRFQALDRWAVAGRTLVVLAFLGVAALGALGRYSLWQRAALGAFGLVSAGVFVAASLNTQVSTPPAPFLVPGGLLLTFLGLVYLSVGLGVCSDNQFVALTRRELSSYFFTPIGYLVLFGMAFCQWFQYLQFYDRWLAGSAKQNATLPEPIVGRYLLALIPILCVLLPVPALTMRLLSEEKRTGSLEVLLTSPVNEWPVVLSKFLSTWLFFLICWLPAGLFLIAVRVEAGAPFDYRPLLSFYLALAVCGGAFIAMGLFFSALTSNQVVAAVLTFMVLLFLVVCYWAQQFSAIGPTAQALLARLSFIDLWELSLQGQLAIRDVLVWASAAVFGLFLTVKVLEARKWN